MNTDRMILGENAIFSRDSRETGLNNNVLVVGSSGSGKTRSLVEPLLLETEERSLIVSITKRRLFYQYAPLFRERGYRVLDLNFAEPQKADACFDHMRYIKSYEDIRHTSESIVMAEPRKAHNTAADPYWDKAAISLLNALTAYVRMTKKNCDFVHVLELLDELSYEESCGHVETSLDERFQQLEEKDPHCFAVSCYRSFQQLPAKTAGCVFGTLNTTIDSLFNPQLRRMIREKKAVDFRTLAKERTVLFVTSSAVNPSLHSFVNMFFAQAIKSLFEFAEAQPDGRLPVPVDIICDDFATGSRILNFPEYISIFREKQISATMLVQSESQLISMYGTEEATTIINNADTYVYLGGMDLQTGKNISMRLNVPLDEVLYMPVGKEYIFRRGQRPISTSRYPIETDPRYIEVTRQYTQGR